MSIVFGSGEARVVRERDIEEYGAGGMSRWLVTVLVEHYYYVTASGSEDARERYEEGDYEDGGIENGTGEISDIMLSGAP